MSRRGENIYKRKDGRWEGRYIKEHNISGKTKYGYVYAHNYKAVKEKLKDVSVNSKISEQTKNKITYFGLTEKWLQHKNILVKSSTFSRYKRIAEKYLIPAFGKTELSDFTTDMIEAFIQKLLLSGRKDGNGGLSPKTVSDIFVVFKSTVEYGKEIGYEINCNIKHLSVKSKYKEMRVLTTYEQSVLTNYLLEDSIKTMIMVEYSRCTGISGEAVVKAFDGVNFVKTKNDSNDIAVTEAIKAIRRKNGNE